MSNRSFAAALALVFLLALGLRLGLAVKFVGLDAPPDPDANPDQLDYEFFAHRMSIGEGITFENGVPSARRSPGTSLTLLPAYLISDRSFALGRIWFCVISASTCLAVAWLAAGIAGRGAAIVSATLLAVYPGHAYYAMHFVSEVPYCLFLALGTAAAVHAWREFDRAGDSPDRQTNGQSGPQQRSTRRGAALLLLAGASLGMATLCRTQLVLLVPISLAALVVLLRQLPRPQWRAHACRAAVALAAFAAVLSPWLIRNAVTFRKPCLSNIAGVGLYGAHNPITFNDPQWLGHWYRTSELERHFGPMPTDEVLRDEESKRRGLHAIAVNLPRLPLLVFHKVVNFLSPFMDTPNRLVKWAFAIAWIAVVPLIIVGARHAWRTARQHLVLFLLPVLATFATVVLFYGSVRFRDSIAPLFITLGGIGAARCLAAIASRFGWMSPANADDIPMPLRIESEPHRKAA